MLRRSSVLILLALLMISCVSPKLTRRYKTMTTEQPASLEGDLVRFSVFRVPATPESKSGVTTLAERGQAAYVKAVAKGAKNDPKKLAAGLSLPFKPEASTPTTLDLTKRSARVVFSIENATGRPADRLEWVKINLKLEDGAKFVKWDKITSKYATVDLGKLTSEGKFSISPEATSSETRGESEFDNRAKAFKLPVGFERSLKEELSLKRRYAVYTGALRETEAELIQDGALGIDLTGNIIVDFTVRIEQCNKRPVTEFKNLWKKPTEANRQEDVRVHITNVKYPLIPGGLAKTCDPQVTRAPAPEPIRLASGLQYRLRHVTRKDRTFLEGDDAIYVKSGQVPEDDIVLDLFPEEELRYTTFMLARSVPGKDVKRSEVLTMERVAGRAPTDIDIRSEEAAWDFLRWLDKTGSTSVAGRMLKLCKLTKSGGYTEQCEPLTKEAIKQLAVFEENWNWERPDPESRG